MVIGKKRKWSDLYSVAGGPGSKELWEKKNIELGIEEEEDSVGLMRKLFWTCKLVDLEKVVWLNWCQNRQERMFRWCPRGKTDY